MAIDILCGLAAVALATAAAEWWRRRRRHLWQFSIRELLVGTLLCAAVLAWWVNQQARHARLSRLVARLERDGVDLKLGYAGPDWLQRLVGIAPLSIFHEPLEAVLSDDVNRLARELAERKESLPYLCKIECRTEADIDGEAVRNLAELSALETLSFHCRSLSDGAFYELGRIDGLRQLELAMHAKTTDAGIMHLRDCKHLEQLNCFLLFQVRSTTIWRLKRALPCTKVIAPIGFSMDGDES